MASEIERKFLVAASPDGVELGSPRVLRQGYLAVEGETEVRIRIDDGAAEITVKGGRGLVRSEIRVAVEPEAAAELWALTEGRRVDKQRQLLDIGGGAIAELDLYSGELTGLRIVEVEFASRAAADAFVAPSWFGAEVTGDDAWSNASLAIRGRPER